MLLIAARALRIHASQPITQHPIVEPPFPILGDRGHTRYESAIESHEHKN
jgi:hypothetical protein